MPTPTSAPATPALKNAKQRSTGPKSRLPLIEAKDVKKDFHVGGELSPVLHGMSATIFHSEFVIIYGPSGSGKSTFLNTLIGLERPTSGEVWVDGIRIDTLSDDQRAGLRAAKFGVVSQQPIWIKAMTVRENVALPKLILNASDAEAYKAADVALFRVGLSSHMKHKPTELSGGQQQRVNFARSLVNDPPILILDEPTGNLDSKSAQQVIDLLMQMNQEHERTIIMITHNLEYLPLADRTIQVRDGLIDKITEKARA